MDHFTYRNGELYAEDVALRQIAAQVDTPFYCYSVATLQRHLERFTKAFGAYDALVCYGVKANSNLAVVRTLAKAGAGAALVSGGELKRALAAGVPPRKIVISGVGKTAEELGACVQADILQINVESEPELEMLSKVAVEMGQTARIGLRINPDVDAGVNAKITTGTRTSKFGVDWTRALDIYAKAARLPGLQITGISVHIGSTLSDLEPLRKALSRIADLVKKLRQEGHKIRIVDAGGGLGVPYDDAQLPGPEDYAAVVGAALGDLGCLIVLEPGRLIAGNAGLLVTRMIYRKETEARTFYVLDSAMSELIRPSLYGAYHEVTPIAEPTAATPRLKVDVVGTICETTDIFAEQRLLPSAKAGDLLALRTAGAYSAVMASTYNSRPLVPEVLVSGNNYAVVRKRMSVEEMLARESVPEWV